MAQRRDRWRRRGRDRRRAARLSLYLDLIRWDRPAGWLLLLWPTLSALWIAAGGFPGWHLLAVFVLGTFLMRSAGCAANDVADRDFDRHVKRTASAAGHERRRSASREALAARRGARAGRLRARADDQPRRRSRGASSRSRSPLVYPFTKRFFAMPQAVLGVAFSFGIPMAFAAVRGGDAGRSSLAGAVPPLAGGCSSATCSGCSPTTPSTRWSTATTT